LGHDPGVGIVALVGLFLGTYLLLASPLQRVVPYAGLFVPAVVGLGFLLAGRLFGMVMGTGSSASRLLRPSATITLLLTVALCAALRAKSLVAVGTEGLADRHGMPAALLDAAARAVSVRPAHLGRWAEIVCMVTIEEAIKLVPVFLLIRGRVIRGASEAMLAGAVGGLCFGMVEAINHSFFLYARLGSPATTYLVRAFVMAPSHGIGAAVACGVAFAAAARRATSATPSGRDMLVGFLVAAAMHAMHNGLQAVCGPASQIATVFLPIAVLYRLVRWSATPTAAAAPARIAALSISPANP